MSLLLKVDNYTMRRRVYIIIQITSDNYLVVDSQRRQVEEAALTKADGVDGRVDIITSIKMNLKITAGLG